MSTTVSNATSPTGVAASVPQALAATPGADDAQDRFLKLLVTQLKNQDPLNPMDNAQMTSQMAQISMVSGIDKLNATLQGMVSSLGASQSLQATAMIGHSVLVPGTALRLQDGTAEGGASLPQPADKVVVSITDASGQLVHQADLGAQPAGVIGFQWDGATDSGAKAAPGTYSFSIRAVQGDTQIDAVALSVGLVSGIAQGQNGVELKINGIGQVPLADVKQVM